jgi:Resolvase, N terminal domain
VLGYARVSTADQNPNLQHDALKAVWRYRIFADTAGAASMSGQRCPKHSTKAARTRFRADLTLDMATPSDMDLKVASHGLQHRRLPRMEDCS